MTKLCELAPVRLRNFRVRRYHGDDLAFDLASFTAADQSGIREFYSLLGELHDLVSTGSTERQFATILRFLQAHPLDDLAAAAARLGRATYESRPSPLLIKTVHDIRGGGLTPLLGQLQMIDLHRNPADVDGLFFLTRDHLKIMRNALLGLDDAKRAMDLQPKPHGTRLLVEKYHHRALECYGRSLRLEVECPLDVVISECCVEFGALDRTLYNLLNNACRHAATATLRLALLPMPDESLPQDLRFVLINTLTPGDARRLRKIDPATLFHDGVSTTGSGAGLCIAAQFVANAYGLNCAEAAIVGGYLGIRVSEDEFAAWFHWPIVQPTLQSRTRIG